MQRGLKNSFFYIPWLLLVIFSLLGTEIGYFYGLKHNSNSSVYTIDHGYQSTAPFVTDNNDLLTYENPGLGFSLQYPRGYLIENDTLATQRGQALNNPERYLKITNNLVPEQPTLLLYVNNVSFDTSTVNTFYTLDQQNNQLVIKNRQDFPLTHPRDDKITEISASIRKYGGNDFFFYFYFRDGGTNYENHFKGILNSMRLLAP